MTHHHPELGPDPAHAEFRRTIFLGGLAVLFGWGALWFLAGILAAGGFAS